MSKILSATVIFPGPKSDFRETYFIRTVQIKCALSLHDMVVINQRNVWSNKNI